MAKSMYDALTPESAAHVRQKMANTLTDYLALIEYDNLVCIHNRTNPLTHDQYCFIGGLTLKCLA